ncbi:MAG: hypothetical protein DRO88_09470 [Promethearchaeia archaeon]|nr:MAG: hypothetical protein DRO88_09470 [Candidatus Lokiarchaeia archaeon]
MSIDEEKLLSDFTRFYLLVILYEGPIHGYGLKQKYIKRLNRPISDSLIYPFLTKLDEKGYLISEIVSVGKKDKKVFSLNEEGKNFAEKMFHRFSGLVDTAIEPNIQICAGCGIRLYQNSYQEIIDGTSYNFCCIHCAKAFKNHNKEISSLKPSFGQNVK